MAQETLMVLTIDEVTCENVLGTLTWQNMPPATILFITLSHESDHYQTMVGDGTQADSGVYDFTQPFSTDDLTGWRFRAEAEITSEIPYFWFEVPGEHTRPCPVTPTPEDVTPTPADATPEVVTPESDPPVVSLPSTGTGQSASMASTFCVGVGILMLVVATSLTMSSQKVRSISL